jgi:hypothetical protein
MICVCKADITEISFVRSLGVTIKFVLLKLVENVYVCVCVFRRIKRNCVINVGGI